MQPTTAREFALRLKQALPSQDLRLLVAAARKGLLGTNCNPFSWGKSLRKLNPETVLAVARGAKVGKAGSRVTLVKGMQEGCRQTRRLARLCGFKSTDDYTAFLSMHRDIPARVSNLHLKHKKWGRK